MTRNPKVFEIAAQLLAGMPSDKAAAMSNKEAAALVAAYIELTEETSND
jgi:hypothetical protein